MRHAMSGREGPTQRRNSTPSRATPGRAEESDDLFRQGMLRVARAMGEAERARPREAIELLDRPE